MPSRTRRIDLMRVPGRRSPVHARAVAMAEYRLSARNFDIVAATSLSERGRIVDRSERGCQYGPAERGTRGDGVSTHLVEWATR